MNTILDFNTYIESIQDGGWYGFASNKQVRLPSHNANSLRQLESKLKLDILIYYCSKDMGASYIHDLTKKEIIYFNLPCESFAVMLNKANINYELSEAQIVDGVYDSRQAQYRIDVKVHGEYAVCKVLGIFTEPNLLDVKD